MLEFRDAFLGPELSPALKWHNPPADWGFSERQLVVRPAKGTDFWQKTYYGFTPDSGHFLYMELAGDFVLETHVHYGFVHKFDQGGLMVRTGPQRWLKAGVEYQAGGAATIGAVVTRERSDWSLASFKPRAVYLRLKRLRQAIGVYFAVDGNSWRLIRLASLPMRGPVQAGLFAASPTDAGFVASFDYLAAWSPQDTELD
jgi:uncharacterized protein